MPLPSSFWVDEAGTMFVVRQGAHHPSLAVAPQVPASIYFWLPRAADQALRFLPMAPGITETAYRFPSVLALLLALFLVARLTARLIDPCVQWFSVFACLSLRGIDYAADDARPYALGLLIASAAMLYLVRWLDGARRWDAVWFIVFAALLWRVHLVYWPMYAVFGLYAGFRLVRSETRVSWRSASLAFGLLALTLIPVLGDALALFRQASAHVIVPVPAPKELQRSLKLGLVFGSLTIAWMIRKFRPSDERVKLKSSSALLAAAWWLTPPVALFAFSWATGNSVFVGRYLSIGLPGVALAATAGAASQLPRRHWLWASLVFSAGVLLMLGDWREPWPRHHNSDWRAASLAINGLPYEGGLPVICPSPFIEAKPPVWTPSYPLPGFLYAQLATYPVHGKLLLFPYAVSPEAQSWAVVVLSQTLLAARHFVVYGGAGGANYWREWYAQRPELRGWTNHRLGDFGDVEAIVFDGPR